MQIIHILDSRINGPKMTDFFIVILKFIPKTCKHSTTRAHSVHFVLLHMMLHFSTQTVARETKAP